MKVTYDEIWNELCAAVKEPNMRHLGILVYFKTTDDLRAIPYRPKKRLVIKELKRQVAKGGVPIGLVGLHTADLSDANEPRVTMREYRKLFGQQWETGEACLRFEIGTKEEIHRQAVAAGVRNVPESDIIIVAGGRQEKAQ